MRQTLPLYHFSVLGARLEWVNYSHGVSEQCLNRWAVWQFSIQLPQKRSNSTVCGLCSQLTIVFYLQRSRIEAAFERKNIKWLMFYFHHVLFNLLFQFNINFHGGYGQECIYLQQYTHRHFAIYLSIIYVWPFLYTIHFSFLYTQPSGKINVLVFHHNFKTENTRAQHQYTTSDAHWSVLSNLKFSAKLISEYFIRTNSINQNATTPPSCITLLCTCWYKI